MSMSDSKVNKPGQPLIDMKRLLVMVGDGFSDSEIEQAKTILENAFKNWSDTTVLITNKEFNPIKVDNDVWAKMEKELDE
jgi:hypothetical protein